MNYYWERITVKKICFAVLVHEKREVVQDLLENIEYFCPNSSVVLYNGGYDPDLCKGLGCAVCPTSKKLEWGKLAQFHLEIMKWLHEIHFPYDYLIILDSDNLFIKKGFEEFIVSEMEGIDFMAVAARVPSNDWGPGKTMKPEWYKWEPIFYNFDNILGCLNAGQVFSNRLVQHILNFDQLDLVEKNILETKTIALEEMIYIMLAKHLGFDPKPYPWDVGCYIRFQLNYTKQEVEELLKKNERSYLVHPIPRDMNDEARVFIRSLIKRER
jgi:hypothetical protein